MENQIKEPYVLILSGIPCSGKSTFTDDIVLNFDNHGPYGFYKTVSISRDTIREELFPEKYTYNERNEDLVTKNFYRHLNTAFINKQNIIIDNTNCKEKDIDRLLNTYFLQNYNKHIVFFDIPLYKAYYRNIIRYFKSENKKWIPFKVIKRFYNNYKKINREKYARYILHQ